jgi:hypothetical protein
MVRQSDRLRATIELAIPLLRSATTAAWRRPDATRYRAYLAVSHAAVRATVPLLTTAEEAARRLDPPSPPLADYLAGQIREEHGHDAWLLDDYAAAGGDVRGLLGPQGPRTSDLDVANLVGPQYYWVLHHHPVALLGHIAVREGWPPSLALIDRIKEGTGLPPDAFRALRAHACLDSRHRAELVEVLDALTLSPAQRDLVGVSALHTVRALAAILDRLSVHHEPGREPVHG